MINGYHRGTRSNPPKSQLTARVTSFGTAQAGTDQDVLARIGARYDAWTGRYLVPSEATFRRVLSTVDGDALDDAVSGYVTDVVAGTAPGRCCPQCPVPLNANNAGL